MYGSNFFDQSSRKIEISQHSERLAFALDVDTAKRMLQFSPRKTKLELAILAKAGPIWRDGQWAQGGATKVSKIKAIALKAVPVTPFRVLDAPGLRDDFYCSLLTYCPVLHALAVGLESRVFIWSEQHGPRQMSPEFSRQAQLTSLGFSSPAGRRTILAAGRVDGKVSLWSLQEQVARFESQQPASVACLAWKPVLSHRASNIDSSKIVQTEELLVGDEVGNVYYYTVEWPAVSEMMATGYQGGMTLLARLSVHSQQICGLAWSLEGDMFATGGNNNACCLFEIKTLDRMSSASSENTQELVRADGSRQMRITPGRGRVQALGPGCEKYKWTYAAAIKAIAFCPWQRGLIATGGGSNDRCIHFYHAFSGTCLAKINVASQVTALIWSTTRREIAATFGYASPEHPVRISVFSWPDCAQIVAIPWQGDLRALYAIPYPCGPNETGSRSSRQPGSSSEGGPWNSRTAEEGCIVVAASDESVKFHEIWSQTKRSSGGCKGVLGGSEILEAMAGIERDEEIIR